jgi:hypothetical protein
MNWFIMTKGTFSDERKGPFPHPQFVAMVQQGKISQTTLACSPELTGGQWLPIKDIPILRKAMEAATLERQRAIEEQQRRAAEEQLKATTAPSLGQPTVAPPAVAPQFRPATEPPAPLVDPYRSPDAKPIIQPRPMPSLHVRPVFERYWMPDYLQAIWYLTLAFCALWFLFVVGTAVLAMSYARQFNEVVLSMSVSLFFAILGIAFVILSVRFVLELYAIFYDIRSFVKRQTDLLEQNQPK